MNNFTLKVLLLLCLCFSVSAKERFVSYTEAFDVFEIVDQISAWHPNTRSQYRQYFDKTFTLSMSDKLMLDKYAKVRSKYHTLYPDAENSIFSEEAIANDSLSSSFSSQSTVDRSIAFLRKKNKIKDGDLKELVSVYKHFKPQVSKIVRESALLHDEAKRLNKILKKSKILSNIKKLDKFFDLPTHRIKNGRIKLVWLPATSEPMVDYRGGRVIIRMNPVKHSKLIGEDFVLYSLVDSLFVSLSKNKKENFSKIFVDGCPKIKTKSMPKEFWFQAPLVEAFSRYYLKELKNKKAFNPYEIKSSSPWTSSFSSFLYGLSSYSIKRKSKLDREFMTISANYCSQLLSI
ncbi:hypothetical protein [Halobacteriovorax sp. HLS]|uniref:hypothetical protein n=1 Tax=Halobacteriovorax sp. HLS TaxID=2234000 RepID=UPI000FDC5A30|nr:hypothetical protein [Halobacteriovorax sp. HLS]